MTYPATQHPAAEQIFVGNSEMAQLMRSLDWSQTPLGEPAGWSQSLRTVLSILLTSQHPIFLWWGKELIQFYNDAYRPILGTTKHPQAMGQHGRECWQEIWPIIKPMIEAVMQRGEATRIQDGLLMLERNGYLEECYFNYAYSPVRDETGEVGGVFCACDETTKRVLGERQLKTLRELAAQPLETKTVEEACQLCMGAIAKNPADLPFALLYLMDETGESARLMGTAGIAPGTTASPEQTQIAVQGWNLSQVKLSEQPEILTDLATRFDSLPPSLWDVPPQSAMVVPLNQSGQQQIAGFLILAVSPRRAFDDEYRGFFEVVASQVETAIANARACEEEHKQVETLEEYRTLFESIDEGFCIVEMMFDDKEKPVDYRFLKVNPAFIRLTGLPKDALGKTARELVPDLEEFWLKVYGKVALTGEVMHFENKSEPMNRWFSVHASRVGDVASHRVAIVFNNITERKQAEEILRSSVELNAFRVSLADALRPLADPVEIKATASRVLGEYLGANRVAYFEVRGADYVVERDYVNGAEALSGCYPVDSFGPKLLAAYRIGRAVSASSVALDPNLSPAQRLAYSAIQIGAYIGIPLVKGGKFVAGLAVHMSVPRTWTPNEVALAEEVAERTWAAVERARAEAALRESEAKYRTLFESLDEGLCICEMLFDENGAPTDYRFLEVNSVFGSLTGLEQATGKTARELVPDLEAHWFETYGRVVRTGEPVRFENQSIAMNRWFDVNAFCTGKPQSNQFAVLFTNITDRKQTEIALQESEERLRVAQLSAKIGTWDWDVAADSVFWSPEYYSLYGLDPAIPSTYENWLDTVLEADRATADQAVREALQQKQTHLNFEFRICHPTQSIRWLGSRSQIFYDDAGQPTRAIGISIDVTDRKLAEEALRASEQRFRDMADSAPMMVWVTDPTGYCTYLSRSWYDFSGQIEANGLGFGWLDVVHPEDREFSKAIFLAANDRQEGFRLEYRLLRKDGEYRACLDAACPWFGPNGEFRGYIGSVIDIDDRKQAETTLAERARELTRLNGLLAQSATLLEERNLELDRFVHIVSHDLKAPLRGIANLSKWIEEDITELLSEDTRQQMELLRNRVYRMEAMINGLLDYARAGRTDAMIETVDVADLLAEVIDSIAPPPTFQIAIASGMPTLRTKRLLLSQVFSNLIGNGIKHHPRTDGSIRVSSQDLGDFYEFIVADDGPGIAPEYHDKIFMIFQTVNPQKNVDSSGVGLSIVKKIVETEEGTIRLESQIGKGTTFYFTWPKAS
jgi:PAS domain S-box-containing protein